MEKVEAIAGANKLKVNLDGRDLPSLAKLSKQRKSSLLGYLVVTKNKLVEEKDMEEAPPEEEDHNQDPQEELVLLADLSRSKCAQLR